MAVNYRADHVGSLLRPPGLLQARADFAENKIGSEELLRIENESILKALKLQEDAGVDVFTDGEYRRSGWNAATAGAIEGLVEVQGSPIRRIFGAWKGPDAEASNASLSQVSTMVAGARVTKSRRFVATDAAFLRAHARNPWKVTLPGPMSMAGVMFEPGVSTAAYPRLEALAEDLAAMVNDEFRHLVAGGAPYVQLDSLHYVERVADTTVRPRMIAEGDDPDHYLDELIRIDNLALDGVRGTEGVTVGLHMCRGNARSRWHAEGGYEPIAEKAFQQLNVDRFLLEYDSDRAGNFEPLRFVPRDKVVVLGLISSKVANLESIDDLRRRVDEATRYVPVENLAISPQCGFASIQLGNLLSWDDQRRKLELVRELAQRALT